jgi:cell division protein ZapA (FtsZ GTPase activity inhibitor)
MRTSDNGSSIYEKFSSASAERDIKKKESVEKVGPVPYRQMARRPVPSEEAGRDRTKHAVSVHIAGMQYRLIASDEDGEAYIRKTAERAEQMIHKVQATAPGMTLTSVTVLALMNAVDDCIRSESAVSEIEQETTALRTAQTADKTNFNRLREINWELKKEILRLQKVIDGYEKPLEEAEAAKAAAKLLPLEELINEKVSNERTGENE